MEGVNKQNYYEDDDESNDMDGDDAGAEEAIENPGDKRRNMRDNPLDRRALQSLEKQLQLETPDSEYDLCVCLEYCLRQFVKHTYLNNTHLHIVYLFTWVFLY